MQTDRSHQKVTQASLPDKLGFLRRNPAIFMVWLLLAMALALIGWGLLMANLKQAHQALEQRALRETNALARTHADRLARSFDSIDQVTRHVRLEWQLSNGRLRLEQLASDGLFPPPALYYVTLVDAGGMIRTSTLPIGEPVHIGSRPYFLRQQEARTDQLVIDAPTFGRLSQRNVVHVSRRLADEGGRFAGIVVVSVSTAFFTANYDPVVLGPQGLLAMVSDNPRMELVRIGGNVLPPDMEAFTSRLSLVPASGSGRHGGPVFEDGRARYLGWHPVRGYDITALVGLDEEGTLAEFHAGRHSAIRYALWASAALALLTGLVIALNTELAWRKHRLGMAQATYRLATEEGSEGFYIVRPLPDRHGAILDFVVLDCNQQGAEFFHVRPAELIGKAVSAFRGNVDTGVFVDYLTQATHNGAYESEIALPGDTALQPRWAHLKIIRSGDNLAVRLRDVSLAKAHVAELKRRGDEDVLTGLPNRHWIQSYLRKSVV